MDFQYFVEQISVWTIPVIFGFFIVFALSRRVKSYEAFVEGGKEGFDIFIQVLPFIVAILVAIGTFRASGGLELISDFIGQFTIYLGMPPEVVPIALMKPLSGSGSLGLVSDLLADQPDSFAADMASTMFGSTDTTFYIIALYFGSVGIRKIRHAMIAGLIADAAGIAAAVWISHQVFA